MACIKFRKGAFEDFIKSYSMNNYTDTVLKQTLAKMLPHLVSYHSRGFLKWVDNAPRSYEQVLDTELLHLCWLVEEILNQEHSIDYVDCLCTVIRGHNLESLTKTKALLAIHATWQQRVIALCKVKGITI